MDKMKLEWVAREKKGIIEMLRGEIKAAKRCIEVMQEVENLLPEWDGKVIDKKMKAAFEKLASKEISRYEYVTLGYYQYGIQAMQIKIQVGRDYSERFYYANIDANNSFSYNAGKRDRLISAPLVERCQWFKNYFTEEIEKMEKELAQIDVLAASYIDLYDRVAAFQNNTSSTFRDKLNLKNVY